MFFLFKYTIFDDQVKGLPTTLSARNKDNKKIDIINTQPKPNTRLPESNVYVYLQTHTIITITLFHFLQSSFIAFLSPSLSLAHFLQTHELHTPLLSFLCHCFKLTSQYHLKEFFIICCD